MCSPKCCMTCCECYKLPRWSCGIFAVLFFAFCGFCAVPVTSNWSPRAQLGVLITFCALALLMVCLIAPFLSRSDAAYYNEDGYEIVGSNGRYTANKGYYAANSWGHKVGLFLGLAVPIGIGVILFLCLGGFWKFHAPSSVAYIYNTTDCGQEGLKAFPDGQCISIRYNGTLAWSITCQSLPERIPDPFSYERKPILSLLSSRWDYGNDTVPCFEKIISTTFIEDSTCIVPNFPGLLENLPYSFYISCNVY